MRPRGVPAEPGTLRHPEMSPTHGADAVTELHDGSSAVPEREIERRPVKGEKGSLPARTSLYTRQVVAEMRKVIWPTRKELTNYTTVVIAFVLVMIAILAVLDYGFGQLMFWVFD